MAVLALGLTAFVAAYAVTDFWNRAERHFANADRTFVISSRIELGDGSVVLREAPVINPYAASYLRTDYPHIEATARARRLGDDVPVAAGDRAIRLTTVAADPEFLEIFDLPFVAGDARGALREPRSVVLTQQTAERRFGTVDPLGKTVSFANLIDATVTGVVGPIPEPSHLGASVTASMHFDMLASMDLLDRYSGRGTGGPENWFGMDSATYVLFPTDGSLQPKGLAGALEAFVHRHMPAGQLAFGSLLLNLVPVGDVLAMRKTLGAATAQIVFMLLRSFSLPVILASVAAWPIAFIGMRLYLDRFVSPIELNALPFVAGLLAMLAIGWLAAGAQTLRAARTIPARVLRQE